MTVQPCIFASFLALSVFLTALNGRWPELLFLYLVSPSPPPTSSSSRPQAQNTQQTGFKGNLRLLLQTLEQPHLPFKILPAALSHRLHTEHLLMLAASTAFHFTPSRLPPSGPWAREDTLLILCLIVKKKLKKPHREERKWKEVGVRTFISVMQPHVKETKEL